MTSELLAIGEVMAEIRHDEKTGFAVSYAGDTYNTAIYGARNLPASKSVAYLTRIGQDPLSQSFFNAMKNENLQAEFVETDSERNIGIYAVSTDATGERSFSYWRNESAARKLFSSLPMKLPAARMIYLSGITLAILPHTVRKQLIDELRSVKNAQRSLIAFDSNYRPALWDSVENARSIMSAMWEITDIALPSIDDEMALFGEHDEDSVIDRFSAMTFEACAIKRGSSGPVSPRLPHAAHPEFDEAKLVIDTTGAGDSFNGAYLAAYLTGQDEIQCLKAAHSVASRVVGVRGAIMPLGD